MSFQNPFKTQGKSVCSLMPLGSKLAPQIVKKKIPRIPERNPFIFNDSTMVDQAYSDCLHALELSVPVNVTPMVESLKTMGKGMRKALDRKAKKLNHNILRTIDSFYVVYIFSFRWS